VYASAYAPTGHVEVTTTRDVSAIVECSTPRSPNHEMLLALCTIVICGAACWVYDEIALWLLKNTAVLGIVFDTFVHGLVAFSVWGVAELLSAWYGVRWPVLGPGPFAALQRLFGLSDAAFATLACAGVACLLDLDHFIAARSVRLHAAMRLSQRPFGHSVLFVVALCTLLYLARPARQWALVVAIALGTHQLRDAIRRGLWLWPFGSTYKLPYWGYLALMGLAPLLVMIVRSGALTTFVALWSGPTAFSDATGSVSKKWTPGVTDASDFEVVAVAAADAGGGGGGGGGGAGAMDTRQR